ncbi:hypothetical protein RND71_015654 [Anisodus tanguticus]|uniref:Uncharacterized protein n=1 Tax=Anisodus tanguticus TaxID=243964 RepID=A0AAE1S8B2_9SOLA|nr:hypothetical protein RND71_015654 [Anisodus tanguticus]
MELTTQQMKHLQMPSKAPVSTEGPSTKLNLPLSENVDHSQPALTNEVKAGVNQVKCPNVPKNVVRPLQHVASNFDPQELEKDVAWILKGNQEVDVTDITPLDVLFEKFFKKHGDYDVVRSSTSQKMTRDSHQELLSAEKQRLHTATKEKIKMNNRLGELQIVLAKTENELEVLTAKKKKTTLFIDEQQKKLSRNKESITTTEDEVHTIERTSPFSEEEVEELAKLKEEVETTRQEILSFKTFL